MDPVEYVSWKLETQKPQNFDIDLMERLQHRVGGKLNNYQTFARNIFRWILQLRCNKINGPERRSGFSIKVEKQQHRNTLVVFLIAYRLKNSAPVEKSSLLSKGRIRGTSYMPRSIV